MGIPVSHVPQRHSGWCWSAGLDRLLRMISSRLGLLALATSVTLAQSPAFPESLPSVALPAPLERVLRDYEKAWQEKDAAALARLPRTSLGRAEMVLADGNWFVLTN